MKIALDIRNLEGNSLDNLANYTFNLAKELVLDIQHEWILITDRDPQEIDIVPIANNLKIVNLNQTGISWNFALKKFLQENKIQQYISQDDYLSAFFLGSIKCSLIITDLSNHFSISFLQNYKKLFYKNLYKKISKIIVPSNNIKEDLLTLYPKLVSEKIHIVPYGIQTKEYFAKQETKETPFILSFTRMLARDNHLTLLRAFNIIKSDINHDLRIVVSKINQTPLTRKKIIENRKEFNNYLKENDLQERVSLIEVPTQEDLKELYSAAELCIYPTLYSGFALPILESFASGTPVICTENSSIPPELKECAMLFPSIDHQDLAKKMIYLLKNKEDQEIYSVSGFDRSQAYNWANASQRFLNLIIK